MILECQTHGVWDSRISGCPECVAELRRELRANLAAAERTRDSWECLSNRYIAQRDALILIIRNVHGTLLDDRISDALHLDASNGTHQEA
jgi:hypothetical protein